MSANSIKGKDDKIERGCEALCKKDQKGTNARKQLNRMSDNTEHLSMEATCQMKNPCGEMPTIEQTILHVKHANKPAS